MEQKMINLTIDNVPVSVPEGTTVLEAARNAGIKIPTLCYLKDINAWRYSPTPPRSATPASSRWN